MTIGAGRYTLTGASYMLTGTWYMLPDYPLGHREPSYLTWLPPWSDILLADNWHLGILGV